MAERLKAMDIQCNIVVDEEDCAGAVALRIADVSDDAVKGVGVKVTAAHFNDGAERAVVRAAARGFDDLDLAAKDRAALENAGATVGKLDFVIFQTMRGTQLVVNPLVTAAV